MLDLELNVDAMRKWLQEVLEDHDGASKVKYTNGLGQDYMAFCSEVEDVISMRKVAILTLKELTQESLFFSASPPASPERHELRCIQAAPHRRRRGQGVQ